MPAFERAVELGIRYLETDCHATSDGEIVLCHDANVARMCDGTGRVSEMTYAELQQLDAGYRFTPDGDETYPFRGKGVRIARLAELLEAFPDTRINLEVKQEEPAIAAEVLRVIRAADAESRTLLAAAEDPVIAEIRALDPGTALGSSVSDVVAFYSAIQAGTLDSFEPLGHVLQIPSSFGESPLITEESLAAARQVGLLIHVWTINDADEIAELIRAGVDGVMSDHPALLLETAKRLGSAR
jgi:glycerophosphoryl diester phosphodiesterase